MKHCLFLALLLPVFTVYGQRNFDDVQIRTEQVAEGVWSIGGYSAANTTVIEAEDGLIVAEPSLDVRRVAANLLPLLYLPDSNMFVTTLVLHCLLDAQGLGVVEVEDTPATRGMLNKVSYMVDLVEEG